MTPQAIPLVCVADWTLEPDPPFGLLGPRERVHVLSLPAWRRTQWAAGRLTARAAQLLALGAQRVASDVLVAPDGAPLLVGGTGFLSIAHSRSLFACAVLGCPTPLGVDVEFDGRGVENLLPRIAAPGESPLPPMATRLWTAKEAALKACRAHPGRLNGYRVSLRSPETGTVQQAAHPTGDVLQVWFETLPGAVAAVVAPPGPARPRFLRVEGQDILDLLRTRASTRPRTEEETTCGVT